MNVFKKRPLSLILCIMLGGFSFFADSTTPLRLALIAVSIVIISISFVFGDLLSGRNLIVRIICGAFALSLILAELFSISYIPHKYIDETVEIRGIVKEIDEGTFSTSLTVKADTINGKSSSKTVLIQEDKSLFYDVSVGDSITVEGVLEEFERSSGGFDERSYYFSRGFNARISKVDEFGITRHTKGSGYPLLLRMRDSVSARLKQATNEQTGGFLAALIMGDKSALDGNTNLNYSLIGISHILALSGMHLVIISEMLRQILLRMRLRKKSILIITTLFCLFYMAITGFSASVVRSAVMLTITNGLFLITGAHDSYTTLPLSVVLILIVQPHAVFDISLWLSAFATLGVLVYSEIESRREKKERGIFKVCLLMIWQSIFATIFAIGAAYPIMLKYFDTGSLFAPITTLIFSFPINFLIFAGFIVLICYPLLPLGKPVIFITDLINEVAELFASIQWGIYSMDYIAVRVLIIAFAILFYAVIVLNIKRKKTATAVLIFLFFSISVMGVILTQSERNKKELTYIDNGYSDIMLMKFEGDVTLVKSGTHSAQAAYRDAETMISRRISYVDNLILTSYNKSTVIYGEKLFSKLKTEIVYMPKPQTEEELRIAEDMAYMLKYYGTCLRFIEAEVPMKLGAYNYYHLKNEPYIGEAPTDSAYTVLYAREFYTYLSVGMTNYNAAFSRKITYSSDYVIFGAHGNGSAFSQSFGLTSTEIKRIYYIEKLPLSAYSLSYLQEKEVPITRIDTSYQFIR